MNPTTETTSLKKGNSSSSSSGQESKNNNLHAVSQSNSAGDKKETSLNTIFQELLKDVYSAEQQLVKALPEVVRACYTEELADIFNHHLDQTKKQIERLDKVFDRLKISSKAEKECEAMKGLIKEVNETIEKHNESPARDSALIIGAQKIEHYEIASYGSLCELADVLGYHQAYTLLDRTLQEEGDTDHILTSIAQDINDDAVSQDYEVSH